MPLVDGLVYLRLVFSSVKIHIKLVQNGRLSSSPTPPHHTPHTTRLRNSDAVSRNSNMRESRPWTREEDERLQQALQCQGDFFFLNHCKPGSSTHLCAVGNSQINWLEVASHLEGRNNKDCRKRWVYSLTPSIRKGAWEEWEDSALCEAVEALGTRYAGSLLLEKIKQQLI